MSGEFKGPACAYMKGPSDTKGKYMRIGSWFKDRDGRVSLVIDALPLPHTPWTGWINLFENEGNTNKSSRVQTSAAPADIEDDIPF